ncbi:hypothetical protein Sgly_0004 [Syntrophobotulus glycolicus DSM 8271]|uniref:DUF370 domain-containing protein n=1 Tax=Syntrophobotulus glycolicus (strain DSM 8271 / FlGlyR) TaxID=645991 RepID=F0SUH2_SYNGF|nr:extracellular matrix/biofilm biosynthesis regulator RemA family protein [Syntrophobotulus glycolicus]ADY54385.1 hypothetical protein Sgly_0004 [Syntrophobotulus glycolicus DSM 8271]
MFIHIGANYMVKKDKIIAILDLEAISNSQISKQMLKSMQKNNDIHRIYEGGKEKSLIITTSGNYISPISSFTLLKRSFSKIGIE